jgi:putative endopeptidase
MNVKSGILTEDIDPTIPPQDDLYRAINERWFARTAIPSDKARYGSFMILAEEAERAVRSIIERSQEAEPGSEARKIGDLYASFMDAERIEARGATPIRPLLDAVQSIDSVESLFSVLGDFERRGISGMVHLFIDNDPGDPNRYVVFVSQGGISLPDERYYREERFEEIRAAYRSHVATMLELGGLDEAAERADRIVALETEIASRHWDNVASRDSVKTYNLVTWDELVSRAARENATMPELLLKWRDAIGLDASVTAEVVLRQPSFWETLPQLVTDDALDAWRDWLSWRVIHGSAPYLSSRFVEENFAFYGKMLSGVEVLRERWKRGVSFVEGAMGEAVGKLYVAEHFAPESKQVMDGLVANLLEAYRQSIAALPWMGEETRARAQEKLSKFNPKIGYPKVWRDYGALIVDSGDLWGNVERVAEFGFRREIAKIGKPVDRDEWFMTPQTVNAYYNPGFNEIVFPAAILQFPFFESDRDDAANYGAIGAVIGHEIGHGFDDQGSRFDGDGKLEDWWTEEDRAAFETQTKALIDQYGALAPRQVPDQFVNGELTIGENIGDLGGLGIAWKAYLIALDGSEPPVIDGLTGAQRFFYSWAQSWREMRRDEEMIRLLAIDPHSPSEFRCNQTVRNIDAFHEAFGTNEDSPMWLAPEARVKIW